MKIINLVHLLFFILTSFLNLVQGQSKEYVQTITWFSANNIEINNPSPPAGFKKFLDCDSHLVYKKVTGDTILFYRMASSMAKNLENVLKISKRPYFNVTVFPQKVLETGAILITRMEPTIFLLRNDSLYLLDNSERDMFKTIKMFEDLEKKAKENIDSLLDNFHEFTGDAASQWEDSEELENLKGTEGIWSTDHPDYFRVIFHKKMFLQSNTIVLQRKPIEFKGEKASIEERVDLLREWKQQDKECFYIRIYGQGGYGRGRTDLIFNLDGTFLNFENCQVTKKSILDSVDSFKPPDQKNNSETAAKDRKKTDTIYKSQTRKRVDYSSDKTGSKRSFSEPLAKEFLNGKWGFVNKNGNEVVPIKYDYVNFFIEGIVLVAKRDGEQKNHYGYVDKTGKEITAIKYGKANQFGDGLASVALEERGDDTKWGYVDKTGKEVIPLKHDRDDNFHEGLARLHLNGKVGFMDRNGTEVISPVYDNANAFNEGLAEVARNGKWGFIDKTGKEVVPLIYNSVSGFKEGLSSVRLAYRSGVIDKTGMEIVPIKYDFVYEFHEGLLPVSLHDKYGFVDESGREVIPLKYDFIRHFSEGLAVVVLKGKQGFVDKTGKEVIPLKYDACNNFHEGLAAVSLNRLCGYVDKNGKEVVPLKYEIVNSFNKGLASVKLNGKWGIIDKRGELVVPITYENISNFSEGLASITMNGKVGFIDTTGKLVVSPKYDKALGFQEGLAGVAQNGKWGFINKKGVLVIPFKYDTAEHFMRDYYR